MIIALVMTHYIPQWILTNTLMDIRFVYTAVQTNLDNALRANGNHGESFTKTFV